MSEKLHKALANAGLGSRREMETWITAGRVSVNGDVAELGLRVKKSDQIRVDGKPISIQQQPPICRVLMYNKPEGELCARKDPKNRATVFDRLPKIGEGRWIAIGRLDINTSGLLLFTNDGELANRLMHPKHQIEREYSVRVFGEVSKKTIKTLTSGVKLEDGMARFTRIKAGGGKDDSSNTWYKVKLAEGRNREVRRLWESQDVQVSRLIRIGYGDVKLNKRLPRGGWIELSLDDINPLRASVNLPEETQSLLKTGEQQLDHAQLTRIRRSVKKKRADADNQKPKLKKPKFNKE
jgi:23S rRNA pseudouridine2605 synthase